MKDGKFIIKTQMRPASSGLEDIFSKAWIPVHPKAILQIAHGMAETVSRYDDFASFMASNGYLVVMNEHAGHGKHAATLGYFAEANGLDHVVQDMKSLMDETTTANGGLPTFLLGHSMGSFLARKYITLYGNELCGCVLSGTAGGNPALGFGKAIASLQKKLKGSKSPGKLLNIIAFGTYNKKIADPVNAGAWLSRDRAICTSFAKDPYCGFTFTAGGFYDLFCLLGEINTPQWASKVPQDLPVYLFSGDQDPVGNYGKGPAQVCEALRAAGNKNVSLKLYADGRHEMLNEINKEEVYCDTLTWLDAASL